MGDGDTVALERRAGHGPIRARPRFLENRPRLRYGGIIAACVTNKTATHDWGDQPEDLSYRTCRPATTEVYPRGTMTESIQFGRGLLWFGQETKPLVATECLWR